MQYTIHRQNKFHQAADKAKSKSEDILLSVVMFLAKLSKSRTLNDWLENYTQKKIQKLQSEIIRMNWDKVTLDKAAEAIHQKEQ